MSDNSKETFVLQKRTSLGLVVIGIICVFPFAVSIWHNETMTLGLISNLVFGCFLIITGGYSFFKSRHQAKNCQS